MLETFVGVLLALAAFSNPRAFVGIALYIGLMTLLFGGLALALVVN